MPQPQKIPTTNKERRPTSESSTSPKMQTHLSTNDVCNCNNPDLRGSGLKKEEEKGGCSEDGEERMDLLERD